MKAGIISYTKTLAQRIGPLGVNVNCICPGIVYTDAWKGGSKHMVSTFDKFKGQDPEEWFEGISQGKHASWFHAHPLRRPPTEEDCAQAIVFSCS